jgi:predicted XRE-type DNA-binding protein
MLLPLTWSIPWHVIPHGVAPRRRGLDLACVSKEIGAREDAAARIRTGKRSSKEAERECCDEKGKASCCAGKWQCVPRPGHQNADVEQSKAILAAEIIKALDRERLTVRAAHGRTGIAAADFSRIRNADLGRFTVDRLMSIINRLGSRVDVKVRVRRAQETERSATA